MAERRRTADLRRRVPLRQPRLRLLLLCEGEKTEPRYFEDLKRDLRNPLVELRVHNEHSVPRPLVERAIALRREAEAEALRQGDRYLAYDEVWCVFDVDGHPNLQSARRLAASGGIHLAISNPCFELWVLLHFEDQTAHIKGGSLKARVRRYLPGYVKELPFEKLKERHDEAIGRASSLERLGQQRGDPEGNPSTGVHRLVARLRASRET